MQYELVSGSTRWAAAVWHGWLVFRAWWHVHGAAIASYAGVPGAYAIIALAWVLGWGHGGVSHDR